MLGKCVIHCLKRFAVPISDDDVKVAQASAVPRNNRCKITKSPLELPPHLLVCSAQELDVWMSKFVLEARHRGR